MFAEQKLVFWKIILLFIKVTVVNAQRKKRQLKLMRIFKIHIKLNELISFNAVNAVSCSIQTTYQQYQQRKQTKVKSRFTKADDSLFRLFTANDIMA